VTNSPSSGARFMYAFGAAILVAFGSWFGFGAIDSLGLESHATSAVVQGKSHRDAGQTYTQEIINNRAYTVAQSTPELHILSLVIAGEAPMQAVVERELYTVLEPGDTVRVTYQRRRFTRGLQIVGVTR
jgi:hypothetical protein